MIRAMDTFGEALKRLMSERGLSQRAMATAAGVSQSYIAQVLRGARPVAEERIGPWAEALGLKGRERERFRLLALLTRCPEEVREHVARLEARKQG